MCFRPAELSMNTCPECGKKNKPIAKVCEACGAALGVQQNVTCPICGMQNPATATTCAQCGATAEEIMAKMGGAPSAPGAPAAPPAPGAPRPPAAPGAPQPPAPPGAPKPPAAPSV
ncbi:MAG: zinc-ribbon domain-containing protein [Coriobacteriales bacterium]|nr:zinc-ribbon domain-containing protein [Coriobacteriales bacterium]